MPKIYTMSEFERLPVEMMDKLLPIDFIPEVYCRQFGRQEYFRFNHMVSITNSAIVKLSDGSSLHYIHTHAEYFPQMISAYN